MITFIITYYILITIFSIYWTIKVHRKLKLFELLLIFLFSWLIAPLALVVKYLDNISYYVAKLKKLNITLIRLKK